MAKAISSTAFNLTIVPSYPQPYEIHVHGNQFV